MRAPQHSMDARGTEAEFDLLADLGERATAARTASTIASQSLPAKRNNLSET